MDVLRVVRLSLLLATAAVAWTGAAPAVPRPVPAGATIRYGDDAGAPPPRTTEARKRRRRPGCGRFCRQAGGFGAGPDEAKAPVLMRKQRVRVDRDDIIAIRATCRLDTTCVGAILVDGRVAYGRADLRIRAHVTRRVEVGVSARGLRSLRRRGRDRHAFATVPLKGDHPLSISRDVTLLPPR